MMENQFQPSNEVLLKVNDIAVDVDLVAKMANIEVNNNDEKISSNANEEANVQMANQSVDENLTECVNGTQKEEEKKEGDLKVTQLEEIPSETPKSIISPDLIANESLTKANDQDLSGNETNDAPQKKKKSFRRRKNRAQTPSINYDDLRNYQLFVTKSQRRVFLKVPRGCVVPVPKDNCEVFCSNIPINVFEHELMPLFERYGHIWELRLMMSKQNLKRNAGFAFVRYVTNEAALKAAEQLNQYEILPGKLLSVRISQPNLSLFVSNIHRGLTRDQIHEKMKYKTKGLINTFLKNSTYEETKNCGFCFLEYNSHYAAVRAKRLLREKKVWGRHLLVDWAQRRTNVDDTVCRDNNSIFINFLPKETTIQIITEYFSTFGPIEKVNKIKDYAFVKFIDTQAANDAIKGADKLKLGSENIEILPAIRRSYKRRYQLPFNSINGVRKMADIEPIKSELPVETAESATKIPNETVEIPNATLIATEPITVSAN